MFSKMAVGSTSMASDIWMILSGRKVFSVSMYITPFPSPSLSSRHEAHLHGIPGGVDELLGRALPHPCRLFQLPRIGHGDGLDGLVSRLFQLLGRGLPNPWQLL